MSSFLHPVYAVGATHFRDALATNAATAINALPGVPPINSRRYYIRAIEVQCMERIGPQFLFYGTADGITADVDTNTFLSYWGFVDVTLFQRGAAGLWLGYVDGLAIPYYMAATGTRVAPPTLNVSLQNTSATAKSAGDAGAISATFWLEPMAVRA